MNKLELLEAFIKEKDLEWTYTEWLESKLSSTVIATSKPVTDFPPFKSYDTEIDYDVALLSYQVEVLFPRVLNRDEQINVEDIINYWSAIPYVSTEGNDGMSWGRTKGLNFVKIEIDLTKSASDDYRSREILEKLAEWIWKGTPERRDRTRKHESLGIKPLAVRADSV